MLSPSSRAEWVEMYVGWYPMSTVPSPSSRAEWVEISVPEEILSGSISSPSSRAEWVEINIDLSIIDTFDVSVLAGGVG